MDYFDLSKVFIHEKFEDFLKENKTGVFLTDTQAKKKYSECSFNMADTFVFGSESRGINKSILNKFDEEKKIYIPMYPNIRSINICNSVSIIAYECLRQNNYKF